MSNVAVMETTGPSTVPALTPITPMAMLAQAVERGMSPDTVDKLMVLAERWESNQARKTFNAAVAAAKAEIPVVAKTATGHNSKKYADFAAYARAIDPVLGKHGLGYRFRTTQDDKLIRTTCVLFHRDGYTEENTLVGPADQTGNKNAIQAIGSTLTYLQRYCLVQALGLAAAEDDDGRAGAAASPIGAEDATTIREMLDAIPDKSVEQRLLKWLKVGSIEAIPAGRYDEAVENLKKLAKVAP